MKWTRYVAIVFVAGFLGSGRPCLGAGLPALRIGELVSQSDVVVVADVSEIKSAGPASVNFNGVLLSAERYHAQAVAHHRLEGSCPDQFVVEFVIPNTSTGYRSAKPGARLLFLRRSGVTYVPTSPYYPDFPPLRSEPVEFQGKDVTEAVFAVLAAVMAFPDASADDKWEVLQQSFAIPDDNKLFMNDLHVGLQSTSDPDLRRRIQAELIIRNNVSEIPEVCDALLAGTLSTAQKDVLLYAIGQRLKNERGLPKVAELLQSPDPQLRIASAQALWHIASASSIKALVRALNDGNHDVRYYAIRGLADVTGDVQWGPSPAEYEEHEAKYVSYWREWAASNVPRETPK